MHIYICIHKSKLILSGIAYLHFTGRDEAMTECPGEMNLPSFDTSDRVVTVGLRYC